MKKILFSLAIMATLCISCGKGDSSNASEQSKADTTADSTAVPTTDSVATDTVAAEQPAGTGIKDCLTNLLNGVQYNTKGHTNAGNQKSLASQYCTASFKSRAGKTISNNLNVFGPNWSDFCSDESEQVRHVTFTVPEVTEEGTAQSVKVKISYDTYYDDFDGHVKKDGHKTETFTFKMVKEGNDWKVDDVIVNGGSLCNRWQMMP